MLTFECPSRVAAFVWLCLACFPVAGCGDDGGVDDAPTDGSVTVDAGSPEDSSVSLSVSAAREQSVFVDPAPAGAMFAFVSINLEHSKMSAVDGSPDSFRLRTTNGFEIAALDTGDLTGACRDDALLAPGASQACTLVFELEQTDEPSMLVFDSPRPTDDPAYAEAPLPTFERCERCGDRCSDELNGAFEPVARPTNPSNCSFADPYLRDCAVSGGTDGAYTVDCSGISGECVVADCSCDVSTTVSGRSGTVTFDWEVGEAIATVPSYSLTCEYDVQRPAP